ncbi:unnamed protein product, partial [Protopolystoma xenopodis]
MDVEEQGTDVFASSVLETGLLADLHQQPQLPSDAFHEFLADMLGSNVDFSPDDSSTTGRTTATSYVVTGLNYPHLSMNNKSAAIHHDSGLSANVDQNPALGELIFEQFASAQPKGFGSPTRHSLLPAHTQLTLLICLQLPGFSSSLLLGLQRPKCIPATASEAQGDWHRSSASVTIRTQNRFSDLVQLIACLLLPDYQNSSQLHEGFFSIGPDTHLVSKSLFCPANLLHHLRLLPLTAMMTHFQHLALASNFRETLGIACWRIGIVHLLLGFLDALVDPFVRSQQDPSNDKTRQIYDHRMHYLRKRLYPATLIPATKPHLVSSAEASVAEPTEPETPTSQTSFFSLLHQLDPASLQLSLYAQADFRAELAVLVQQANLDRSAPGGQASSGSLPHNFSTGVTDPGSCEDSLYWAKGTGFATGGYTSAWNTELAESKTVHEDAYAVILYSTLASFISAFCIVEGSASANQYAEFIHPHSISTRSAPGAQHFLHQKSKSAWHLSASLSYLLTGYRLPFLMQSHLRNDSALDMAKRVSLYRSLIDLIRAISRTPSLHWLLVADPSESTPPALPPPSSCYKVSKQISTITVKTTPFLSNTNLPTNTDFQEVDHEVELSSVKEDEPVDSESLHRSSNVVGLLCRMHECLDTYDRHLKKLGISQIAGGLEQSVNQASSSGTLNPQIKEKSGNSRCKLVRQAAIRYPSRSVLSSLANNTALGSGRTGPQSSNRSRRSLLRRHLPGCRRAQLLSSFISPSSSSSSSSSASFICASSPSGSLASCFTDSSPNLGLASLSSSSLTSSDSELCDLSCVRASDSELFRTVDYYGRTSRRIRRLRWSRMLSSCLSLSRVDGPFIPSLPLSPRKSDETINLCSTASSYSSSVSMPSSSSLSSPSSSSSLLSSSISSLANATRLLDVDVPSQLEERDIPLCKEFRKADNSDNHTKSLVISDMTCHRLASIEGTSSSDASLIVNFDTLAMSDSLIWPLEGLVYGRVSSKEFLQSSKKTDKAMTSESELTCNDLHSNTQETSKVDLWGSIIEIDPG